MCVCVCYTLNKNLVPILFITLLYLNFIIRLCYLQIVFLFLFFCYLAHAKYYDIHNIKEGIKYQGDPLKIYVYIYYCYTKTIYLHYEEGEEEERKNTKGDE